MFEIPDYVSEVLEKLNNNGFEAYLAGGCVRDFLMGKTPSDYDITTSAEPYETKECFAELPVIETGIKHGTVTVVTEEGNIEITTYRIDGEYKDSRHPENVRFSKNISDDLKRRDFTVNAMAYHPKTGIVDLYSGQKHISEKIISCVGNADKRFSEDALRILRGMRFASVLDFEIDEETRKSIFKNKNLIKNISAERIFVELKKLISGMNADKILICYREVIEVIIAEFSEIGNDDYKNVSENLKYCGDNLLLRLCLFLSPLGAENAVVALKKLKADNKTIGFVKNVLKCLNCELKPEKTDIKHFLKENSLEILRAVIKIKNITENKPTEKFEILIEEIINNNECYTLKNLAVNGGDLIQKFSFSGAYVGDILMRLLDAVIDGKVENSKDELMKYIFL